MRTGEWRNVMPAEYDVRSKYLTLAPEARRVVEGSV